MRRNWIRNIIGGCSFASALFVFQACYGTPQDFGMDLLVQGQVKSKTTGLPIKGIKVSALENIQYDTTDEKGTFSFYTEKLEKITIRFEDIDAGQNGSFVTKDSLLTNISEKVYLDIVLIPQ